MHPVQRRCAEALPLLHEIDEEDPLTEAVATLIDLTESKTVGQFVKGEEKNLWTLDYAAIPKHHYRLEVQVPGHDLIYAEDTMPDSLYVYSYTWTENLLDNLWGPPVPSFSNNTFCGGTLFSFGSLPKYTLIYGMNYNALENSIREIEGYSFTLVDADTVRNLSLSDETLLPYKYIDGKKDVRWNTKKVNTEVLQGILQGESIPDIAKRLSHVTEMNKTAAVRNARTMVTGAENKGRQDSYERATADGIILEKEWIETNDGRTRHTHRHKPVGVGGEIVGQDEAFSNGLLFPGDPAGHPAEVYNCRCTMAAIVKGFRKVR